jgi:hypothetical protein
MTASDAAFAPAAKLRLGGLSLAADRSMFSRRELWLGSRSATPFRQYYEVREYPAAGTLMRVNIPIATSSFSRSGDSL